MSKHQGSKNLIVVILILGLSAGLIIGFATCLAFGPIAGLASGFGASLAVTLGCLVLVGLNWIINWMKIKINPKKGMKGKVGD